MVVFAVHLWLANKGSVRTRRAYRDKLCHRRPTIQEGNGGWGRHTGERPGSDEEEIKVIDPPQLKLLLSKGVDLNRKI